MGLVPGSRIGPYEVIAQIGVGGMGTVYRARDTKLNRDVALKVLPDSLTNDPARLARFHREAQVLASVNHAHIGGIHGLEDASGITALVLELVEGPTLAERIERGPLPLDEALPIATQIADALETAHEQGIVHRDLKPANIKVRPDGTVKVLDFGLAKALDPPAASPAVSQSPTIVSPAMTQSGMILGTAAYMSPEQARGQHVDKRTDIWAFGCVLFEMLTATRAFPGDNVSDVVASVIRGVPSWNALPASVPPRLTAVLQRCLEKDVKRRFRDIGDVKLSMEDAVNEAPATATPGVRATPAWRMAVAIGLGAIAGAGAVRLIESSRTTPIPARVQRFELTPSQADPFTPDTYGANVAISPDASRIVYTSTRRGAPELVVRGLDRIDARPIAEAASGFDPFFSPDSQHIGFATFTELKRVPAAGGPAVTICALDAYFSGASWGANNTILFTQASLGLFRTSASGGQTEKLAAPDTSKGERSFKRPVVLPGGQAVLYTVVLSDGSARIDGRRLDRGDTATVIEGGFGPQYLPPGYLLFGQGDRLMAVRFDAASLTITGSPVSVQEGAFNKAADNVANVVAALDGTAVYVSGHNAAGSSRLVWVDRRGTHVAAVEQPLEQPRNPSLSPDGRRLAITIGPPGLGQLWVYDLSGALQPVKLTFQDHNTFPVWSHDGKQIVFMSRAGSAVRLLSIPADGSAVQAERVIESDDAGPPVAWSPDGAVLLYKRPALDKIWLVRLSDRKPSQWLQTPFGESAGSFSPDGRWVAFASNQTGGLEVWVRPFPGPGAPVRVSSDGGRKPLWSRDGKEIFFENGAKLLSARVVSQAPDFRSEAPRVLFEGGFTRDDADPNIRFLDVAPDGRFLAVESTNTVGAASMIVVQHWDEELKRLLPNK